MTIWNEGPEYTLNLGRNWMAGLAIVAMRFIQKVTEISVGGKAGGIEDERVDRKRGNSSLAHPNSLQT